MVHLNTIAKPFEFLSVLHYMFIPATDYRIPAYVPQSTSALPLLAAAILIRA